jgi:HAE1 family hydrophobic/amphiphilic exporter-1
MNASVAFVRRPVATLLLTAALVIIGLISYRFLPVAALPRVDVPTISVSASMPGASPGAMTNTVSTPLIKEFSTIPSIQGISATNLQGSSSIVLEFSPERDIDRAAADVQAAISRAQPRLPIEMTSLPVYRKLNLADAPVLLLALRSDALPLPELDALARALIVPRLTAVEGVGQVTVSGSQKHAVRIQLDPQALAARRIGVDEVDRAVRAANAAMPAGAMETPDQRLTIEAATQLGDAAAFRDLIVASRNGRQVRLGDVARVINSVEDDQRASWHNGEQVLVLAVQRQPDANTVKVVDSIRAFLPVFQSELGDTLSITALNDRSTSIRAAIDDMLVSLAVTIVLVCGVIHLCLGRLRMTMAASIAVPVSIAGTFAAMHALGLSLDNITLLALTLSVGLVVDDAIVVADSIAQHVDRGVAPSDAAGAASKEVGFTVIAITVSLVAAFIPLLFMDGVVGRILSPFAVTVSVALGLSALVSLTLTPMLAAHLPGPSGSAVGRRSRPGALLSALMRGYSAALDVCLKFHPLMLILFLASVVASAWMFRVIPKGFLPQEDIGQLVVSTRARSDVSFPAMMELQGRVQAVLRNSPSVDQVVSEIGATGNAGLNEGRIFVELKAKGERPALPEVVAELRRSLDQVPGIESFVATAQSARMGGKSGRSPYQITVQAQTLAELRHGSAALARRMSQDRMFVEVSSDLGETTTQATIRVDHDKARQLGISSEQIRSALHIGFAARQAATIHDTADSYAVLVQFDPRLSWLGGPLDLVSIRTADGVMVPLSTLVATERSAGPRAIHQLGQLPVVTISFDTSAGVSLGQAMDRIGTIKHEEGLPPSVVVSPAGTARVFQHMLKNQALLLTAAVLAIYVVLGILYESFLHPLTILAGLPAAAAGAVAALHLFQVDLGIMGLLGILLLFGIVKKNAIMMIDVAIVRQRAGAAPRDAIRDACLLRFRPILMTTLVALVGSIPIAIGQGASAELRQPLGIAVIGGLVVSQVLTLFITPVLYLYMDQLSAAVRRLSRIGRPSSACLERP